MIDKQMHSKNLSVELDKSRSTATSLIIDGVDVSGCAYFWNKECRCTQDCIDYSGNNSTIKELFHKDTGIFADCENSPNCYYKQLKRKEQECEELKRTNKIYEQSIARLKDEKLELQNKNFNLEQDNYIKTEIVSSFDKMTGKYCHLKQIFAEIKEIAKRCGKRIPLFEIDEIAEDLQQILQKINEVEDEKSNN